MSACKIAVGGKRMRVGLAVFLFCARAWAAMPAVEQNALVMKYCTVCHTDAANNGGLSLQHYDAARRDPALAAMMLSKLNGGAMGAAGNGVPEKAVQQAWLSSTVEQAVGAREWFVNRDGGEVWASVVREVPVREVPVREPGVTNVPLYRVRVSCNVAAGVGDIQLTWSPQPQTGRTMTASVDGEPAVEYRLEGQETMGNAGGNGGSVRSGHASVVLSAGRGGKMPLPRRSLTIRDLFPGEVVEFPFAGMPGRGELGRCF